MLLKNQIKERAKYSVYTHLFSVFFIVFLASLIPNFVSSVAMGRVMAGIGTDFEQIDAAQFLKDYNIASALTLVATFINLPFQYCLFRYFLILSGTPATKTCSFRAYFSGCENVGAFLKGAVIVLILELLSAFGIFVGYFPVYLAFCMAPFLLAMNPEIKITQAFRESRRIMRGHKKEAFSIILEFVLVRVGALILSLLGLSFFSLLVDTMALSLLYTSLATIFITLKADEKKENEA